MSVLVTGEAGVGKSRLAAELADHVRADRGLVVELAGSSFHTDVGLHPVQRLAREARSGIGAAATGEERLARLRQELGAAGLGDDTTALLAPVLGLSPEAGYDAAASEGRKLNDEITRRRQALRPRRASAAGPGSCSSRTCSGSTTRRSRCSRSCCAKRRGDLLDRAHVPGADRDLAVGTTIEVEPPRPRATCIELIDVLDERALDRQAGRAWSIAATGSRSTSRSSLRGGAVDADPDPSDVPDVLYEPLVAPPVLHRPRACPWRRPRAAIGREVDRDLLQRAVDLPADAVDAELEALIEGRVLAPDRRARRACGSATSCCARWPTSSQPPSQRRRVHGRVADLLVGDAASRPRRLARGRHPLRARRPHRATPPTPTRRPATGLAAAAPSPRPAATSAAPIDQVLELPDDRSRMHQEVDLRLRRGFLAMSAEGAGQRRGRHRLRPVPRGRHGATPRATRCSAR